MSGIKVIVGSGLGTRLALRNSFAATMHDLSLKSGAVQTLADLRVGPGGWILQAKATVRVEQPESIDVQLRLAAVEGSVTVENKALASVSGLGYATIVAVLGVEFSSIGQVTVEVSKQHLSTAELSGMVITGIREDNLTLGEA
jgi:hypothetical protein